MGALCTDRTSPMPFGLIRFYKEARGGGVKPVVGADVWLSNEDDRDKPARLLLLVQDRIGYLNLCTPLSRAWLSNQHRGRAEIEPGWFEEPGEGGQPLATGLIALSGAMGGDVGMALVNGNADAARRAAARWAAVFPQRFYIELQRAGHPGTDACVQQAVHLAAEMQLPVVATHPVQFMTPDDFTAHEARVCIAEGELLANPRRTRRFTTDQYFKTQDEMCALFADIPSALQERRRDRAPLQPDAGTRQAAPAVVPDARRHVARRLPGLHGQGRPREAPGGAVPR
ncbi:PHP domain-containing protein [Cupriavidus basilensis]